MTAHRHDFHNVLTNPIPYNIQNPYILKEMSVAKNPSSYLAMKGSQNIKPLWWILYTLNASFYKKLLSFWRDINDIAKQMW